VSHIRERYKDQRFTAHTEELFAHEEPGENIHCCNHVIYQSLSYHMITAEDGRQTSCLAHVSLSYPVTELS
jgi:hypothetical protein